MIDNMRIAYILDWKFGPKSGVAEKILDQIMSWGRLGAEITLYVSSPTIHKEEWGALPIRVNVQTYSNYLSRSKARNTLLKAAREEGHEIFYTRFGILNPFAIRTMKKVPTILELNTKGLIEYKRRSRLLYLYARLTCKTILNNSAGICAITQEVANEAERIVQRKIHYEVFPNSIDLTRFPKTSAPKNIRPKLVFVGSPGLAWHGVDRLNDLAIAFPEYDFYVIGPKQMTEAPKNIQFIAEIYGDELTEFLGDMDVAISSLALDRNLMLEGSPIKTRLYLALGLPVILGYRDTGISRTSKYIFEISPSDWPISDNNRNEIRNFVSGWKGLRVPRESIYSIDSQGIEKRRLDFMLNVVRQRKIKNPNEVGKNDKY